MKLDNQLLLNIRAAHLSCLCSQHFSCKWWSLHQESGVHLNSKDSKLIWSGSLCVFKRDPKEVGEVAMAILRMQKDLCGLETAQFVWLLGVFIQHLHCIRSSYLKKCGFSSFLCIWSTVEVVCFKKWIIMSVGKAVWKPLLVPPGTKIL